MQSIFGSIAQRRLAMSCTLDVNPLICIFFSYVFNTSKKEFIKSLIPLEVVRCRAGLTLFGAEP